MSWQAPILGDSNFVHTKLQLSVSDFKQSAFRRLRITRAFNEDLLNEFGRI